MAPITFECRYSVDERIQQRKNSASAPEGPSTDTSATAPAQADRSSLDCSPDQASTMHLMRVYAFVDTLSGRRHLADLFVERSTACSSRSTDGQTKGKGPGRQAVATRGPRRKLFVAREHDVNSKASTSKIVGSIEVEQVRHRTVFFANSFTMRNCSCFVGCSAPGSCSNLLIDSLIQVARLFRRWTPTTSRD